MSIITTLMRHCKDAIEEAGLPRPAASRTRMVLRLRQDLHDAFCAAQTSYNYADGVSLSIYGYPVTRRIGDDAACGPPVKLGVRVEGDGEDKDVILEFGSEA